MLGDVVEFGQWKTHLRQESFIFAIGSVGTKLGNGITAAILTQLLAFSGYVSKAGVTTQPQSVVNMIMNIYKSRSIDRMGNSRYHLTSVQTG